MKQLSLIIVLVLFTIINNAQQPNVIVVLADDVGVGDISYYRKMHSDNIILETPSIDNLANEGLVFTNAHAPAALCAPSRYAIMTGNNCHRSPFPWGVWGSYEESPIRDDQMTLGKLMQQAGYKTAFFGKWHLGGDFRRIDDSTKIYRGPRWKPETDVDITKMVGGGPLQQGFDYSFTMPAGIQDVPYAVYENQVWMPLYEDSEIGYISQENMSKIGVKLDKAEGLGDTYWDPHIMGPLLVNKAVDYIERQKDNDTPFFMYYSTQAVHLPHNPPKELNGVPIAGTTPSAHMDMIKELDVQMGMLVDALKKKGLYENTVFIFTSDNGGLMRQETLKSGHKPSSIYRGGKNQAYEGGQRVPFIVTWPDKVNSHSNVEVPVLGIDIMATLAALTQQDLSSSSVEDSYNLLPVIVGEEKELERTYILTQGGTGKEVIIIEDNWKLIIQVDKKDKTDKKRKPIALFNLADNPWEKESENLIGSKDEKERVNAMFSKYNSANN